MKRVVFLLTIMLGLVTIASYAQNLGDQSVDKIKQKEARKTEKQLQVRENSKHLKSLFANKQFVLEANTLYNKYGESFPLNSNINFVGFDGKNSTIQLAFENLIGWNGVGGVTLDGTVIKMKEKDDKKGLGFTVSATVRQKTGGIVTMIFRVSPYGSARVDMSGSFGRRISFQGYIVSLDDSKVYKGTPII